MTRAVLLDRDGTINVDKGYVHKVEDFEFIPGAVKALKSLYDNDRYLFVVTNQSGIALKYYTVEDMQEVHDHMCAELGRWGVHIEEIVFCPHHPSVKRCACRKPGTGMLDSLISKFNIDVKKSYMIGDKEGDVKAGKNAGLITILLGGESKFADYSCKDLLDASTVIMGLKR